MRTMRNSLNCYGSSWSSLHWLTNRSRIQSGISTRHRFIRLFTSSSLLTELSLAILPWKFHLVATPIVTVPNRRRLSNQDYSSSSVEEDNNTFVSVLQVVREKVKNGTFQADRAQDKVAQRLARLQQALLGYENYDIITSRQRLLAWQAEREKEKEEASSSKHEENLEESKETQDAVEPTPPPSPPPPIPRGLYIHGPVGTGKSMLMDTFFEHAPVPRKARFHFHSFLAHIHQQIHNLKQQDLQTKGRNFTIDTSLENNPIYRVGFEMSQSISLLCLDEFQVTDIADALILSQLFSVLFRNGTVLVATSNRPPQDLYEGGLNRSYFLPFLELLHQHCIVHAITSDLDYRTLSLVTSKSGSCCFGTHNDENMQLLLQEDILETIVGAQSVHDFFEMDLAVGFQRTIRIPKAYEGSDNNSNKNNNNSACRLDFSEWCDGDFGAMDYRAVARHFDIVCLEQVEIIHLLENHNRARRFITLMDELYEAKCCLYLSTKDPVQTPMELFRVSEPTINNAEDDDNPIETELGIDVATQGGTPVGALASVRELAFAFERASSRIVEMCSQSWWQKQLGSNEGNDDKHQQPATRNSPEL